MRKPSSGSHMPYVAPKAGHKVAKAKAKPSATLAPTLASQPVGNGVSAKEDVPLRTEQLSLGSVVMWAVKCLYVEEVIPRGPILQWFLSMLVGVKLGHRDLRLLIDEQDGIRAEPLGSKKLTFVAVLDKDPPGFKGFVSDSEVAEALTEDLWEEAARCLALGGWPKAEDIAHKHYVVASWLQDASEKFRSWSFGRVLVLVRFAAQNDCLLGHRNGLLAPYEVSEEYERHTNAQTGLPTHVKDGEKYVKSWKELQDALHKLFKTGPTSLEVSKLKLVFRNDLSLELSETVFGHQCLSRLLADPKLGSDFVLELCQGNRYMLRLQSAPRHDVANEQMRKMGSGTSSGSVPAPAKAPAATAQAKPLTNAQRAQAMIDRQSRRSQKPKDKSTAAVANNTLPPPPGLSLPGSADGAMAPPGLAMEDLSSWPRPADAATVATPETVPKPGMAGGSGEILAPSPEKTVKPVLVSATSDGTHDQKGIEVFQ